ncbi:gliding motility protein RemB [Aureivirga sp. CE67]|uniref:gliding motility protein RemB n=1 Tax=Aureivirga sp. CE67 TaxID=1788983 RepID=UPI0018C957E8|nr:gliding motility protein RemB [Aureivirga sp. CE67]
MKKELLYLLVFLISFISNAQEQEEKYPVFEVCETKSKEELKDCFNQEVEKLFIQNIEKENASILSFEGKINVVFIVTNQGEFKAIYSNTNNEKYKEEIKKAFQNFPKITSAKLHDISVEMRFVLPAEFPIVDGKFSNHKAKKVAIQDALKKKDSTPIYREFNSNLFIPLVHSKYDQYEYFVNQGDNSHSASKPYSYNYLKDYKNLNEIVSPLLKEKKSWFGRKLWNEHLATVDKKDYWFNIDFLVDLQLGKDKNTDYSYTYNNTRALQIEGGIGKHLNFYTIYYESQARFSKYVDTYARSLKADGFNPGIVPGRGVGKEFGEDGFDYPVAEAYLTYAPNKMFDFTFGTGHNFVGDGYRSLILSDVSTPNTYFKINTTFWKIKYTNLWMWLRDVRPEESENGVYGQKFMAMHYFSLNITKDWNVGLFESALWDNTNKRGFDVNYINPLIFYRAVEFATGPRSGNALVGITSKLKLGKNRKFTLYGQMVIDEFTVKEIFARNGYWGNKLGFQLGGKYYDAFNIKNLYLQGELNIVRPYTYSHKNVILNYGNENQALAHPWGANFKEAVGIIRYTKNRWYANAKLSIGEKGFDFDNAEDSKSYGGNIYKSYLDNRVGDYNNKIGQGNKANIYTADLQAGYIVNPATKLKLYAGVILRNFDSQAPVEGYEQGNTVWLNFGLRADIFDWYFDF